MKALNAVAFVMLLASVAFAAGTEDVTSALKGLCTLFNTILPVGIMLVIVLAGVVFAVGQTMGAETRARANVWATNLLIGALIAGAVYVIAPAFLSTLNSEFDFSKCTS